MKPACGVMICAECKEVEKLSLAECGYGRAAGGSAAVFWGEGDVMQK